MALREKMRKYYTNKVTKVKKEYVDFVLSEEDVYTALMCVLEKRNYLDCLTEVKSEIKLLDNKSNISLEENPEMETAILLYRGLEESRVKDENVCSYHMPLKYVNKIIENAMVKIPAGKLHDAGDYIKLTEDEEIAYPQVEKNNYNLLIYLLKKQEKPKVEIEEIKSIKR